MQIQVNFKVDPQDDNPIIIEKLFQVIFLDSHQHNAPSDYLYRRRCFQNLS